MAVADLTPRTAGLIPLWLVPLLGIAWACLVGAAAWGRGGRHRGIAREIVALGVLGIAHLLFFWRPLLTPEHVPRGGGDLNSFFFPLHAFSAERIRLGELPLWNPHLHGGMPQLANFQAAVLYPPNLLAYAMAHPFRYGTLELMALAHYLIASVGAYALARSLGIGRVGAVASGIIFPYSGFLVAHLGHYSMLSATAWVPLLLLTVRLTVLRASWLWSAATALIVFLIASAGHQQTLLYALTVAGAWWVFWMAQLYGLLGRAAWPVRGGASDQLTTVEATERRRFLRPVVADAARGAAGVLIGLGMAAPMILPSLQLARQSVRTGLSFEQSTEFSVEPVALIQLILPKVFGSNPTDYWGAFSNGEIWAYAGIATLVLAGIALALRPTPDRVFLACLGLIAVLYALGPATPVQGWAYRFAPLYDLVRAPARAYLYLDLSLALLGGFGIHEISRGLAERCPGMDSVLRATLRVLLVALASLVLFVIPLFYSQILGVNDPSNRPVIAVDGLNLLALYLGVIGLLIWAVWRGRLTGPAAGVLAVALITVDLFSATAGFNPTPDDLVAGFRHPEAVDFLRDAAGEGFRIESATAAWQPDLAVLAGLRDVGGVFDPMQPASWEAARQAAVNNRSLPLYDLLNVKYVVTDANAAAPGPGFNPVLSTGDGLVIWENPEAWPRAWLAYSATPADLDTALTAVRAPDFDPAATLYVTGELPAAEPGGSGTATVTRASADEVRVQVETDRAAHLVLADPAYPGWQATVDGRQAPVATADGLFRAVTVPAGAHEVVFRFQPRLVTIGWSVAGLSLLGLVGLAAAAGAAGRRRPRAYPGESG